MFLLSDSVSSDTVQDEDMALADCESRGNVRLRQRLWRKCLHLVLIDPEVNKVRTPSSEVRVRLVVREAGHLRWCAILFSSFADSQILWQLDDPTSVWRLRKETHLVRRERQLGGTVAWCQRLQFTRSTGRAQAGA